MVLAIKPVLCFKAVARVPVMASTSTLATAIFQSILLFRSPSRKIILLYLHNSCQRPMGGFKGH